MEARDNGRITVVGPCQKGLREPVDLDDCVAGRSIHPVRPPRYACISREIGDLVIVASGIVLDATG